MAGSNRPFVALVLAATSACLDAPRPLTGDNKATISRRNSPLAATLDPTAGVAHTAIGAGTLAVASEMIDEVSASLVHAGLAEDKATALAIAADKGVAAGVLAIDNDSGSALRLADERTALGNAGPLVVQALANALPDVIGDAAGREQVLGNIVGASFAAMSQRSADLSPDQLSDVAGQMMTRTVESLALNGLSGAGDSSRVAGAVTSRATEGMLERRRDANAVSMVKGIVSGSVTALGKLALEPDALARVVGQVAQGAVGSLSGLSPDLKATALSYVATDGVQAMKDFTLDAAAFDVALSAITAGAVSGLTKCGLSGDADLGSALKTITGGAVQGLGAGGFNAAAVQRGVGSAAAGALQAVTSVASPAALKSGAALGDAVDGALQAFGNLGAASDSARIAVLANVVEQSVKTLASAGNDADRSTGLAAIVGSAVAGVKSLGIEAGVSTQTSLSSIASTATNAAASAGYASGALTPSTNVVAQAMVRGLDNLIGADADTASVKTLVAAVVTGVTSGVNKLEQTGAIAAGSQTQVIAAASAAAATSTGNLSAVQNLPAETRQQIAAAATAPQTKVAPRLAFGAEVRLNVGAAAAFTPVLSAGSAAVSSCSARPALPTGLSLNATTCVLTGTPRTLLPLTPFTVTASSDAGSADAVLRLAVDAGVPQLRFEPATPVNLTVGVPASLPPSLLSANGAAVSGCRVSPALPPPLTLNSTTCQVSGTPAAATGNTAYTLIATNAAGDSLPATLRLVIAPTRPLISFTGVTNTGFVGVFFAASAHVTGGGEALGACTTTDAIPAGLGFDGAACKISGTPTVAATNQSVSVTVTGASGLTSLPASISLTFSAGEPVLSYSVHTASFGQAFVSTPSITSLAGNVTGCSINPALPSGLTISATTCAITGVTDAVGSTVHTVSAVNSAGLTGTVAFAFSVQPTAPLLEFSDVHGFVDSGFSASPSKLESHGAPIVGCSATVLPDGVTLNANTCELSGVPTAAAAGTLTTITATNAAGLAGSVSLRFYLEARAPELSFAGATGTARTFGQAVSIVPTTRFEHGSAITACVTGTTLPAGLSIDPRTCVISGTASTLYSQSFSVTATNGKGSSTGASVTITVTSGLASVSYASASASATYGVPFSLSPQTMTPNGSPVTDCHISPSLPAGLSLSAGCVLSGTPTAASSATSYSIKPVNLAGDGMPTSLSLTVSAQVPTLSYSGASGTNGIVGSLMTVAPMVFAGNGATVTTCAIRPATPALPAGLTVDNSCVITGTPTTATDSAEYQLYATNSAGNSTFASVFLKVIDKATVTYPVSAQLGIAGVAVAFTPSIDTHFSAVTNCTAALPPGLAIDSLSCAITGTPTSAISNTYTVTVTNGAGAANVSVPINIQTYPCDSGSMATSCTISSPKTYANGTVLNFNTLTINAAMQTNPNARLMINATGSVTFGASVTMLANFTINAASITIPAGAMLRADALGYTGGVNIAGNGQGGGGVGSASKGGVGGSYGGAGGNGCLAVDPCALGALYGDDNAPTEFGSAGGGTTSAPGGAGGGAIVLTASGAITVDGTVRAVGYPGASGTSAGSGGGAGGSILISAQTLTGTGSLDVSGGTGGYASNASSIPGGGGGGGRIHLDAQSGKFKGTVSTKGGYGGISPQSPAAPGAFGSFTVSMPMNSLCDSGNTSTTCDITSPTYVPNGLTLNLVNLHLGTAGAIKTANPQDALAIVASGNVVMDTSSAIYANTTITAASMTLSPSARIDASGLGNPGGVNGRTGFGAGGGRAAASGVAATGGSHGGSGGDVGNGASSLVSAPGPNDNFVAPILPGSGGGSGTASASMPGTGGAGGGRIKLAIANTLTLSGYLIAVGENALPGYLGGGGGAGGSVWIQAGTLAGTNATISVNGGYGGDSSDLGRGSGGGGGRVRIAAGAGRYRGTLLLNGGVAVPGTVGLAFAGDRGELSTAYANPCDTGDLASSCVISSTGLFFGDGDKLAGSGNLSINSVVQTATPTDKITIDMGGNVTINSSLTGNPTIFGQNVNIPGTVNANGGGFPGGKGQQPGGVGTYTGGGGGHSGSGGSVAGGAGGGTYGDPNAPLLPGSGGGRALDTPGGAGGGTAHIVARGTLTISGTVSADGAPGNVRTGYAYSGAGAGGSVWLDAASMSGNAVVSVNGGVSPTGQTYQGGGGGGGRIALNVRTSSGSPTFSAVGGGGAQAGANGSFVQYSLGQYHKAFVSSASYGAAQVNSTGVADGLCAARASAAGLNGWGWKAVLSTEVVNSDAATRLILATGPLLDVRGRKLLTSTTTLWAGVLESPLATDELGAPVYSYVWTGSTFAGQTADDDCANWTNPTGAFQGSIGSTSSVDDGWVAYGTATCDQSYRLYCISQ